MEEHQNNTDTDLQDNQADSGEGAPKVIKAGSEARPGRRVPRGGPSNGGNQADGPDYGATEAARSILKAGQQTLEAEGSDLGVAEAARSILKAGQQTLESADAVAYVDVDVDESRGVKQVLDEWASCVGRAYQRNIQAVGDLAHCHTFHGFLQWQSHLLNATVTDLWDTNARILQSVTRKA